MGIVITIQPTEEPISLAEGKAQCRIDGTAEDDLISGYIKAARRLAEKTTGRAFVTRTYAYTLDGWPCDEILMLPNPPLIAVSTITYKDDTGLVTTYDAANYVTDPSGFIGRLKLRSGSSWPSVELWELSPITITYTAGYGLAVAVPDEYKLAIKLLVSHFNEHREAVDPDTMTEIPYGVKNLLGFDRVLPL